MHNTCDNNWLVPRKRRFKRSAADSLPIERWWRDRLNAIIEDDSNQWTRAELARSTGASRPTISAICDGKSHSSVLVAQISEMLADLGLRTPEVAAPVQGDRGRIIELMGDLDPDDLALILETVSFLHRKRQH